MVADAYARQKDTAAEFALYDALLQEFAAAAGGHPLATPSAGETAAQSSARASYNVILDRYLARLTASGRVPQALALLRRQLDANPNDPAAYERLASFLEQNNLSSEQEQIYAQAIARFDARDGNTGWYDRLARLYLRQKRAADFATLTRKVTDTFSGTELDAWFSQVNPGSASLGPQLALELNLYAAQRFPHDPVFVQNLLNAYDAGPVASRARWEQLLRRHWWETPSLRDEFFEYLSRTGKLDAELAQLKSLTPDGPTSASANPAATRELAEADLWRSDFQASTPLMGALATLYPADPDLADRVVSLYRSAAYLDPTPASTERAVAIETGLLTAFPDSPDRLGTLGDLYAEATATGGEDLPQAAPYWRRIPMLHAGSPAGFLTAATVFWDYFQFDEALAELTAARTRFAQPALFGYEAGAIDESRHDLPAAVREYTAAVLAGPSAEPITAKPAAATADTTASATDVGDPTETPVEDPALTRLLQLAHRKASAALVDQATAVAVDQNPSAAALTLRAQILITQNRQAELAPTLDRALTRVSTPEAAAALGVLAQAHSLTPVYERALERQIALSQDPVQQIQLQLALARSYEDRKDLADANRVITVVYHGNPRLLGVVRATVDFYDRTGQPKPAIATLLEAAGVATPQLKVSFTLEAAQTANSSGDTAQGRALGQGLLATAPASDPYDGRFLAVVADSYARAGDNAGLRDFYTAELTRVKADPSLTPDARKQTTALLRRGLMPALARLHDDEGVVDQYIALLSAYPEDAPTAQQAALYALAHHREPQLAGFLQATVKSSPRDSRFAILLAETESTFDDPAAALAAYSAAIAIRKDRVDLYTARVDLELRLDQPDAAAEDYTRLYQLTYRDPAWMVRLAGLRARQGRPADAVKALQTAYIDGRPPSPLNQFAVAAMLERWNLLAEARTFAAQGVSLAGPNLLVSKIQAAPTNSSDSDADEADATDGDASQTANTADAFQSSASNVFASPSRPYAAGVALYARILTRLGQPDQALATLTNARRTETAASPGVLTAALARAKLDPRDRIHARDDLRRQREQAIDQTFNRGLNAIAQTVRTYATPEGRVAFARLLDRANAADRNPAPYITAAHTAGLADREADYLRTALLTAPDTGSSYLSQYIELQRTRLRFGELAATLEAYAPRLKVDARNGILVQAAGFYRSAGDMANELRLERRLSAAGDAALRDRFFNLLLAHDPDALTALARDPNASLADAAADFALEHAPQPRAYAAIDARGRTLGPLWRNASTALAGLYFASSSGAHEPAEVHRVDTAFRETLGSDATIADRLAHPARPGEQLTGAVWFAYGADYGVYRETVPSAGDPEDFAAAALEHNAGAVTPYLELARTYAEAGKPELAHIEYAHGLELSTDEPVVTAAILDERAALEQRTGHAADALTSWRMALERLAYLAERNAYPDRFWSVFASITGELGRNHLTAQLRPEIERVLRAYLAHNPSYRTNELMRGAYTSSATPAEGIATILAAANGVPEEIVVLSELQNAAWLPAVARAQVLRRQLELARAQSQTLSPYQVELIELYLRINDLPAAEAVLAGMPEPRVLQIAQPGPSDTPPIEADPARILRVEVAVRSGRWPALLAQWTAQPDRVPSTGTLDSTLRALRQATPDYHPDAAKILPLAEFVFEQKRLSDALTATDFLSLAENRIRVGDLPGALDLLHRLSLRPAEASSGFTRSPYIDTAADVSAEDLPSASGEPEVDPYANIDAAARLLESTGHLSEAVPYLTSLVKNVPWGPDYGLRLAQAQRATPATRAEAARNLLAVAADARAPYTLRLKAARLLHDAQFSATPLGSAELNLIAGAAAPSVAAAGQPYFTAARVQAAAADHADAPQLLRDALAADPAGPVANEARLALLTAELDAGQNAAALTLVDLPAAHAEPAGEEADEAEPQDEASQPVETKPSLNLPAFAAGLPETARLHLAAHLAAAYEQQEELGQAMSSLRQLQAVQPDPSLSAHIARLQTAIELARRNAARRPILHSTVEQTATGGGDDGSEGSEPRSRLIRPRLLSLNAAPAPSAQEAP